MKKNILLVFIITLFTFVFTSCSVEFVDRGTFKKEYKIEYVLNGGVNDPENPDVYTLVSETIVLKDATANHCTFLGWYSDEECTKKVETIEHGSKGDITLYAKFDGPAVYPYFHQGSTVSVMGREIEVTYTSEKADYYYDLTDRLLEMVAEEVEDYQVLDDLYMEFVDGFYYMIDEYRYASVLADYYNQPEDYDLKDEILSIIYDLEAVDAELDIAFAASIYRNDYFEDWTEEEIDEYIAGLDPDQQRLQNEYRDFMNGALSSYYSGTMSGIEALQTYVQYSTLLAETYGYENYLEYAYENVYGREYTVEDSARFSAYTEKYFNDLYDFIYDTVLTDINSLNNRDYGQIQKLLNYFYGFYIDYLDDYAEVVGEEYLENYNNYFVDGNYFYSSIENENVTGYVGTFSDGTPLMFLGPENQAMNTFIHEFGHYNAKVTGGDTGSYDLAETQSQGNEMLYYLYLIFNADWSDAVKETYIFYNMYYMASTVFEGVLINDMEKYVYTTPYEELTQSALNAKWVEICNEHGLPSYAKYTNWMMLVLLNYQGYYISYATSAVAALEVLAAAIEDYDAALESYRYIYSAHEGDLSFTEVLENSGLYSVFDEEAYILLKNIYSLKEVGKKN